VTGAEVTTSDIAGIWSLSDMAKPEVPSPEGFAWKMGTGTWEPVWITVPEVSQSCAMQM